MRITGKRETRQIEAPILLETTTRPSGDGWFRAGDRLDLSFWDFVKPEAAVEQFHISEIHIRVEIDQVRVEEGWEIIDAKPS